VPCWRQPQGKVDKKLHATQPAMKSLFKQGSNTCPAKSHRWADRSHHQPTNNIQRVNNHQTPARYTKPQHTTTKESNVCWLRLCTQLPKTDQPPIGLVQLSREALKTQRTSKPDTQLHPILPKLQPHNLPLLRVGAALSHRALAQQRSATDSQQDKIHKPLSHARFELACSVRTTRPQRQQHHGSSTMAAAQHSSLQLPLRADWVKQQLTQPKHQYTTRLLLPCSSTP
jgi:hypothetical protein